MAEDIQSQPQQPRFVRQHTQASQGHEAAGEAEALAGIAGNSEDRSDSSSGSQTGLQEYKIGKPSDSAQHPPGLRANSQPTWSGLPAQPRSRQRRCFIVNGVKEQLALLVGLKGLGLTTAASKRPPASG